MMLDPTKLEDLKNAHLLLQRAHEFPAMVQKMYDNLYGVMYRKSDEPVYDHLVDVRLALSPLLSDLNAMLRTARELWATAPKYVQEFPSFLTSEMPDLYGMNWEDTSWNQDTCPSFYLEKYHLTLWVNHSDKALWEDDNTHRFALVRGDWDDCSAGEAQVLLIHDDWDVIFERLLEEKEATK